MLSINTNLPSLIAQSSLRTSSSKLNTAIERMTTGYKINSAKDNAANYSITTNMTTQIGAYQVAEDNCAMGLDLVTTASESLELINDKLIRLRALTEQASNGTYGEQSLNAINAEASAIVDEILRCYSNTEYNGIKLFGSITTQAYRTAAAADTAFNNIINSSNKSDAANLTGEIGESRGPLQDFDPTEITLYRPLGESSCNIHKKCAAYKYYSGNDTHYKVSSIEENESTTTFQIGINSSETSQISVNTGVSLSKVFCLYQIGKDTIPIEYLFEAIDELTQNVNTKQTEYGAIQNRLESALEEISTQYENLTSSRSTLQDADVAEVSSEYIRQQILQQASATLLATANQSPALALQLI